MGITSRLKCGKKQQMRMRLKGYNGAFFIILADGTGKGNRGFLDLYGKSYI
jgi:hypothetical protein